MFHLNNYYKQKNKILKNATKYRIFYLEAEKILEKILCIIYNNIYVYLKIDKEDFFMTRKEFDKRMENEEITTEDLLTSEFLKKYTSFYTYEEMEEEIGNRAGKGKKPDMDKIIQNVLKERTTFRDMEDMKKKAINFYLENS